MDTIKGAVMEGSAVGNLLAFPADATQEQIDAFAAEAGLGRIVIVPADVPVGIGCRWEEGVWRAEDGGVVLPVPPPEPVEEGEFSPEGTQNAIAGLMRLAMVMSEGAPGPAREAASSIAEAASFLQARAWEAGMETQPGDLVCDPQGEYVYAFGGASPMRHDNPLYYPGAQGVYFWAVVPEVFEGDKVFPRAQGIAVAVRQGEVWWDKERTARFRWEGEDNDSVTSNWHPGAEGIYQWRRVVEG